MAAPPTPSPSLDYWRGFFSGARASIFDAIDAAIRVAAADHPDALRARRDGIAERLYTALVVLPPPPPAARAPGPPGGRRRRGGGDAGGPAAVVTDDDDGAAAAVAPRGDCHDRVAAEAFRVKAALSNAQEKTEAELLELLRALQQLEFTVDAIRVTEIGTAVKPLRKHGSKQIRQLVRSLIDGWKAVVNDWVNNGGAIVDHTPQSMDGSCLEQEEGGLPSPPMDEAAFFATPCTSIQLSEFFDEMDDDGNIRTNGEESAQQHYPANQEPAKKQLPMGQRYDPEQNWKLDQSAMRQSQPYEPSNWQKKQQSVTGARQRPSAAAHGPWTPQKMHLEPKFSEMRPKQQPDTSVAQRRPKPTMADQLSSQVDQNSVQVNAKLEATKRMLQEGYQEFNNAKKQRTIQVVDPQDLPKQRNRNLQPSCKPRNSSSNSLRNRLGIRR
uniref:TFIIS N-terminal domain-containing protein n=1 Tax=Oryza rufipogon TaxID=4529 RepID=A0A0E0NVG0_ORYRU